MPKFEDLPYIREKIASIADETEVMKKKGRMPNLINLPKEEKLEPSESYDDLLSDDLLDDIPGDEDLMSSVAKEKERSKSLEEAMELEETPSENLEGDFLDNLESFVGENESSAVQEEAEQKDDEFDFLSALGDLSSSDEIPSEDDFLSVADDMQNDLAESTVQDDFGTVDTQAEEASLNEGIDDFLDTLENTEEQSADLTQVSDETKIDGLDDLLIDSLGDDNNLDSLIMENIPEISAIGAEDLSLSEDDFNMDSLLSADSLSDFENLDMPLTEEPEEKETTEEAAEENLQYLEPLEDMEEDEPQAVFDVNDDAVAEALEDSLSGLDVLETLPALDDFDTETTEADSSSQMPDLPSLSIDGDDGEIDLSNMLNDSDMDSDSDDDLLDLSALDDLSFSEEGTDDEALPDLDSFDFSENETESVHEEMDSESYTEESAVEENQIDEEDEFVEPDLSGEKIELSPEDRKKVVIRISTFPKEAEVKIAKAIVNPKYSEEKVYPLVKALITHGKQEEIISKYEKLTGDKSLHNVVLTRLSGEAYERKQKSLLSIIEKNVLPILARTAALIVMIAVLVMFYVTILYPTYTASKYYKLGKKNIDENKYEYAEQNFNKAYQVQPRYKEIIAYARKFRDHERNFAAERKYQMAAEQRDDRTLDFEYGEFLRDIDKYEKSLSMYNYWIDKKRDDLEARNGRGETYLKWAEIDSSKLENAENEFLDVLDYQLNNADAINNLLATYIKMNNRKKVLDTYNWAAAYLKKQDYRIQIKTAGYLIDSGDLNEVRRILTNVSKFVPTKPHYPEYDYQLARYNKALLVRPDERKNLENAKAKMETLSGKEIKQIFGSEKAFNRFQANVYNDLGENYYETSRSDIRAFKMFDRAATLNPDFGKAYYNLGNFAYLTKADREEALRYYTDAESKGFNNDIMTYNMGWLYYKKGDYDKAHTKIDNLLKKNPDVDSLKFMKGTILLNMAQYDLAYSELLEVYDKFNTFRQGNGPLDLDLKEHQNAVKMLYQSSNNLGASLYGKYRKSKKHQYFADSLRYFTEAVKYFDIADPVGVARTHSGGTTEKAVPYLNLKMALYPDVFGKTKDALIDDDFNQYEYFY